MRVRRQGRGKAVEERLHSRGRDLGQREGEALAGGGADGAAVAVSLLRALAAKLRRTTDQIEAVGLRPLLRRLAGTLLRLAAADPAGLVRLPQGQIASLVAASRPKPDLNSALRKTVSAQ